MLKDEKYVFSVGINVNCKRIKEISISVVKTFPFRTFFYYAGRATTANVYQKCCAIYANMHICAQGTAPS